ncbi:hypothetical protein BH20ACI2_BH20ACI2_08070 [soil metagenome]
MINKNLKKGIIFVAAIEALVLIPVLIYGIFYK